MLQLMSSYGCWSLTSSTQHKNNQNSFVVQTTHRGNVIGRIMFFFWLLIATACSFFYWDVWKNWKFISQLTSTEHWLANLSSHILFTCYNTCSYWVEWAGCVSRQPNIDVSRFIYILCTQSYVVSSCMCVCVQCKITSCCSSKTSLLYLCFSLSYSSTLLFSSNCISASLCFSCRA